jgi:hypothetical protein
MLLDSQYDAVKIWYRPRSMASEDPIETRRSRENVPERG